MDKTGTLTEGKSSLTDIVVAAGWSEDALLRQAAAERGSEHPLSLAVVEGAEARRLSIPSAESFASVTGHDVEARVKGNVVLLGNAKLMRDKGIEVAPLQTRSDELADLGRTPIFAAVDGRLAGIVAVADTVRSSALKTVCLLEAAGIEPVMMTGNNRRTAEAVARELGITRVFSEVLTKQKASHVAELQRDGTRMAMVGDGVNDAPALAQADVGITIGAGTDVAIETANVVLMRSDPLDIPRALRLSRETVRNMNQSLAWASVYNVLAIPAAAGVLYPSLGIELRREWSALLMSLSLIIVAANAVLLKRADARLDAPATRRPTCHHAAGRELIGGTPCFT